MLGLILITRITNLCHLEVSLEGSKFERFYHKTVFFIWQLTQFPFERRYKRRAAV